MDAVRRFCERVLARVSSETKVCQPNIEFTRKTKKKLRAMFPSCGWTQTRAPSRTPQTPTLARHLRLSRSELAALLAVPLVAEELGIHALGRPLRVLLGLLDA